ncbi:MAG TPA: stalk domain-containing protein [Paenibacillus sp.]
MHIHSNCVGGISLEHCKKHGPRRYVSASGITLSVDGRKVSAGVQPVIQNGAILMSVRDIEHVFGAKYQWDATARPLLFLIFGPAP